MASQAVNKIVIRNLPPTYTVEQLTSLFSSVGKVEPDAFVSGNTRISGKFGFISFVNPADCQKAIDKFNGHVLDGQGREGGLSVDLANENQKKAKIDPATIAPNPRVIIRNLPRDTDSEGVKAIVKGIGELAQDPFLSTNKSLSGGFAFVDFVDVATASRAIEKLKGRIIEGQGREGGLDVEFARNTSAVPTAPRRRQRQRRRSRSRSTSQGKSAGAAAASADGGATRGRNRRRRRGKSAEGGAPAADSSAGGEAKSNGRRRRRRSSKSKASGGGGGAAAAPKEAAPNSRVYFSNLPADFTAEQLVQLASKCGTVEGDVEISSDRANTGRYGFVLYSSVDSASKAIADLSGKIMPSQGREGGLVLQFAKKGVKTAKAPAEPKKERRPRGDGAAAAAASSEPAPPSTRLYIANIPKQFTADDLGKMFGAAGAIAGECFVSDNRRLSGRFGFVNYSDIATATKAISMFHGKQLEGQGKEGGLVVVYSSKPAPVA